MIIVKIQLVKLLKTSCLDLNSYKRSYKGEFSVQRSGRQNSDSRVVSVKK